MSEYQYVAFRAVDRPVSGEELKFMRRQSSRAEITPWSFENTYNYSDFRGDAAEMLRRGYDVHLHYANFGVRTLMIRLPIGLPNPKVAQPYLKRQTLEFRKDSKGPGGILSIKPFHEPGDLEELWEIERLVPLRKEILEGDLRPLYLGHLIMAMDGEHDPEEEIEAPVPDSSKLLKSALRQQQLLD